jgi:hypothetical protein
MRPEPQGNAMLEFIVRAFLHPVIGLILSMTLFLIGARWLFGRAGKQLSKQLNAIADDNAKRDQLKTTKLLNSRMNKMLDR